MSRISRIAMLCDILATVAGRSTCNRAQVAALLVRDGRPILLGYNGAPSGLPHCIDVGCDIGPDGGCKRAAHAEANAISRAAKYGIATDGCELWCSYTPCLPCARLIINAGITKVFARQRYRDNSGTSELLKAGIDVEVV